ncbi:unnamed protein product [Allacma fusca]|uniref:Uncharacterized protein n=1 Tax=Allacma fusca TaxID=39272 RepID=A0A8J2LAQ2_9HEXA|nr:unnamed protein product [Allacma fusca]
MQNENNLVTEHETNNSTQTTDDPPGIYKTNQPGHTTPETNISRTEIKNKNLGESLAAEPAKNNDEVAQQNIETIQSGTVTVGFEQPTKANSPKSPEINTSGTTNRENDEELTKSKIFEQVNNQKETTYMQEDTTKTQEQSLDKNSEISRQSGVDNNIPKTSEQQELNQTIHNPTTTNCKLINSSSVIQSKQASDNTTGPDVLQQEYQKDSTGTIRNARSIGNVINDFDCKEGLFKNSQFEDKEDSNTLFTPDEIVPALLAAVDTKLKESKDNKHRAKHFALPALKDVDETQQEIITKAGRGHNWEFRYIPYQSATIIGQYYHLQKTLPSNEERNIVARVQNNYFEAYGSSGIPVEVQKLAEKLQLSPLGGQRLYILEGGNLSKPRSRKNEYELEDVSVREVDDFRLVGLLGVSFLATKENQEFQVYDHKK